MLDARKHILVFRFRVVNALFVEDLVDGRACGDLLGMPLQRCLRYLLLMLDINVISDLIPL